MKTSKELAQYIVNHYFPLSHRTEPEYSADINEVECCILQAKEDALQHAVEIVQTTKIKNYRSLNAALSEISSAILSEAENIRSTKCLTTTGKTK